MARTEHGVSIARESSANPVPLKSNVGRPDTIAAAAATAAAAAAAAAVAASSQISFALSGFFLVP